MKSSTNVKKIVVVSAAILITSVILLFAWRGSEHVQAATERKSSDLWAEYVQCVSGADRCDQKEMAERKRRYDEAAKMQGQPQ